MQEAGADEVAVHVRHAGDAVGRLSGPVGMVPEDERALGVGLFEGGARIGLDELVGVSDENGVHMPWRHAACHLGAGDDQEILFRIAFAKRSGARLSEGEFVGSVAVGVRDVSFLGLILEMLGDGESSKAVLLRLLYPDGGPDHAV